MIVGDIRSPKYNISFQIIFIYLWLEPSYNIIVVNYINSIKPVSTITLYILFSGFVGNFSLYCIQGSKKPSFFIVTGTTQDVVLQKLTLYVKILHNFLNYKIYFWIVFQLKHCINFQLKHGDTKNTRLLCQLDHFPNKAWH